MKKIEIALYILSACALAITPVGCYAILKSIS